MNALAGMKILFVITKSNWGGAQAYVYTLAVHAQAAGATVAVALGDAGRSEVEAGLLAKNLKDAGIRVLFLPHLTRGIGLHDIEAYKELRRIIAEEKPDVLHLNSSKAGGLGALAGKRAGVPGIIFTAHGWAHREPRTTFERIVIWLLSAATILLVDRVIVVSKKDYEDAPLPMKRKLVLIRNGIAPFEALGRDLARARIRETVPDLHPNRVWILMNGELTKNKGTDIALRAFAQVALERPEPQLVIMNTGEESDRLKRLAENLRLHGRVFFLGFMPDAKSYLSAGDIFLLPSLKEGLPFALLEAGMRDLPVVATETGGIPELVEDGVTGFLVPAGDVPALSRALTRLVDDQTLRTRMGGAFHERIAHDFQADRMIEKTLSCYAP
jgi:glycosyltransferase involved in cell wall biosynthesis